MSRLTVFDPSFDKYKVRVDGHTLHTIEEPYEVWLLGGVVDKLAEYENTQQWISVKERLPEHSGQVVAMTLSCDGERVCCVMNMNYSARHKAFNAFDYDSKASALRSEIHPAFWMPMPEVPHA